MLAEVIFIQSLNEIPADSLIAPNILVLPLNASHETPIAPDVFAALPYRQAVSSRNLGIPGWKEAWREDMKAFRSTHGTEDLNKACKESRNHSFIGVNDALYRSLPKVIEDVPMLIDKALDVGKVIRQVLFKVGSVLVVWLIPILDNIQTASASLSAVSPRHARSANCIAAR